jgi:hypothetical protein
MVIECAPKTDSEQHPPPAESRDIRFTSSRLATQDAEGSKAPTHDRQPPLVHSHHRTAEPAIICTARLNRSSVFLLMLLEAHGVGLQRAREDVLFYGEAELVVVDYERAVAPRRYSPSRLCSSG